MQLTVHDAAKLLSVSEKTIYRWIGQGSLPAYRVSEQYRFNRMELLEWATSRRLNVAPEIFDEPEGAGAPLPSLVEALEAGGIVYRLGGRDKASVLREMTHNLRLPDEVDRAFLLRVLLAREALGSTGIGEGVAIPHVRNPAVLHVLRPAVTLCFLERPVEFGAIDGEPVSVLFSVTSPTVRAHLHVLSRLAYALRDARFKGTIKRQASREDIVAAARRVDESLPATGRSRIAVRGARS